MGASRPTVVVIGAGPAGASAARVSAAAGLRTIVVERHRLPRDKVCGEACTPRAVRSLARVGLLPRLQDQGHEVLRGHLVSPGGVVLRAKLPPAVFGGKALTIRRSVLDALLLEEALRCGAELIEGVAVDGLQRSNGTVRVALANGDRIDASVIVGCDGVHSTVRRALGVSRPGATRIAQAMRAVFENVELPDPGALTLVWDKALLPAYGWVFPLPGGCANVGVGVRADRLKARGESLTAVFERFLDAPSVREALRGARPAGRALGCPLPYSAAWGPCVFDRALLAGDAAGLVNPLTGEGIDLAMESGELAGEAVADAARGGDFGAAALASHERACEATFGRMMRLNDWLGRAFSMPWLLDRIFRAGNRSPIVREQVAQIALGGQRAAITARFVAEVVRG